MVLSVFSDRSEMNMMTLYKTMTRNKVEYGTIVVFGIQVKSQTSKL